MAPTADPPSVNWTGLFAAVAVAATFILVIAGGLVTGFRAGLSVPDWPTSYRVNMFLYPLSKMTGGIYYEHAHRLYGSLVGLTTLALGLHIWCTPQRRWLKWVLLAAALAVVAQGIAGGLRVVDAAVTTGPQRSTLSDESTRSLTLAVAHGVFGQVFLGLMSAIAAFCSRPWRVGEATASPAAPMDRNLAIAAVFALLVQLTLGAIQRQTQHVLMLHITFAAITAAIVLTACVRFWGVYREQPILRRLGLTGMALLTVQIMLGVTAVIAVGSDSAQARAVVSTLHQAVGAALLVQAVLLAVWVCRLVRTPRGCHTLAA